MSYMRSSDGRRLDQFQVADRVDDLYAPTRDSITAMSSKSVSTSLAAPTLVRPYDATRSLIVVQNKSTVPVLLSFTAPDTTSGTGLTFTDYTLPADITYYAITVPPGRQYQGGSDNLGQLWAYAASSGATIVTHTTLEVVA